MQIQLKRGTILAAVTFAAILLGNSARSEENQPPGDVSAVRGLLRADMDLRGAIFEAKSSEEKERLQAERAAKLKQLPRDLMELAEKHPKTTGGLAALYWAAFIPSEPSIAQSASRLFQEHAVATDLEQLAAAIVLGRSGSSEAGGDLGIARVLLNRVKENPRHGKAAELLTCICRLSEGSANNLQPTSTFAEAADLIVSQHAASPDITHFCEILGRGVGSPAWVAPFERHLRIILQANQHRHIRSAATFALASVVQLSTSRQEESAELYQQYLDEFDGKHEYLFQNIEQSYRESASKELDDQKVIAIGKPALETVGVDLDERVMKLSDYHGKVVLLSFWATWCSPCMKLIPHEKAIAKRFKGKPFVIVGVNGDTDVEAARKAVTSHSITWRSFRDEHSDVPGISETWRVSGWPTLYLIDGEGNIRKRWRNDLSPERIVDGIAKLVAETSTAAADGNSQESP